MAIQLLRAPLVLKARGIGRSSHYRDVSNGLFTRPIAIGPRAKAWPDFEVEALVRARIAGKTDDEIKRLVKTLEAKRATQCAEVPA